jgi:nucleoside-diphosphate-sugar epimerase|nr:NAD(P)-dependent oxidoreductase [Panacagrimonas sp.]
MSSPVASSRSTTPRLAALTGATGFIGLHLTRVLQAAGWSVRVLVRRDPGPSVWGPAAPDVVQGSLADERALDALVRGADAVIHLAGLIKATSRADFLAVNRDGASAIARRTRALAPAAHFLLVSSLAARHPELSDYAASKRAGEDAARAAFGTPITVLRPPAVYGPGDRETLAFFQLARQKLVPLLGPPEARAAMIHVADLSRLIALLAGEPARDAVLTACDARADGYRWKEVMGAAARAVGNSAPRFVQTPAALLRTVALVGDAGRALGTANMLNSQKLRELRHPDWSVAPGERAHADGWTPAFDLDAGFADAVRGYRAAGWLPQLR